MLPESISIHREAVRGGVLRALYHHSESLSGWVRQFGAFPPLRVFNDFVACGYDDATFDLTCGDFAVPHNAVLTWQPFAITQAEYDDLVAYVRGLGDPLEIVDLGVDTFSEWFGHPRFVGVCPLDEDDDE